MVFNDKDPNAVLESVKEYYGKTLNNTKDLKTSACLATSAPPAFYKNALEKVPIAVKSKFYGCGSPVPAGIENKGLSVLDLGCGSGQDCYVASSLVGKNGAVYGIDMTDEQLEVARSSVEEFSKNIGYKPKMEFLKGYIEYPLDAGIKPNSIDLVISNCVVNLSPNKFQVIKGAYDVLKNGGEMYFSDVYCDRRLPEHVRSHELLYGECISGAMYIEDFRRICQQVGFLDIRVVENRPFAVYDEELSNILGNAQFYSITYRLFKLDDMEDKCEDYGQIAIYKGGVAGSEHCYVLDKDHSFDKGKPYLVCGNTAAMLSKPSWLNEYFEIIGDRKVHYGLFDCSPSSSSRAKSTEDGGNITSSVDNAACCSSGGGCC